MPFSDESMAEYRRFRRDVGLNILERRTARGWTAEDLALKVRVDRQMIREIESGQIDFEVNLLETIGRTLGIDAGELAIPRQRRR